jgi:hypothetical protein
VKEGGERNKKMKEKLKETEKEKEKENSRGGSTFHLSQCSSPLTSLSLHPPTCRFPLLLVVVHNPYVT